MDAAECFVFNDRSAGIEEILQATSSDDVTAFFRISGVCAQNRIGAKTIKGPSLNLACAFQACSHSFAGLIEGERIITKPACFDQVTFTLWQFRNSGADIACQIGANE